MKRILLVLLIIVLNMNIFAIEFKKLNTVVLEQPDDNFIQTPLSISVLDGEYIYINDQKAVNIKIYNSKGKYIKSFGKKGTGPNEFMSIGAVYIDKKSLLITDVNRNSIALYNVDRYKTFTFDSRINYFAISTEIHFLDKNNFLFSGLCRKIDRLKREFYLLSILDIKKNNVRYIIPAKYFYNKKNDKELMPFLVDIMASSSYMSSVDYSNKYLFCANAYDLSIVRVCRKTNKMIKFGKKSENFTKPYINNKIRIAKRYRDSNLLRRLTIGMSYTMGVFTINEDYIGLPFSKYVKKTDSTDVYIQIYKTSGEFVSETRVFEGKSFYSGGIRLYFDKIKKLLYILDTETTEDFDQVFRVHKYRVIL